MFQLLFIKQLQNVLDHWPPKKKFLKEQIKKEKEKGKKEWTRYIKFADVRAILIVVENKLYYGYKFCT